jgi:RNA polymerase sigma-B factor
MDHARRARLGRTCQGGPTILRPGAQREVITNERARERLLRRYARWRRPEDLEQLVLSYRPLARALARRYATGAREDLEQAAYEGLIKAIHRFEPERGAAFASFAVPTILGELRRHLRDTAWPAHLPRALQERVREVRAAAEDFSAAHGRNPTPGELALHIGCGDEAVLEALGVSSALSVVPLDAPVRDRDLSTVSVADQIGDDDPGFERVECLASIEEALPTLSRGQRTVLRLHFAEDLTQREIAGRLGVSRSEVTRDLGAALARLRAVAVESRAA